LSFCWVAEEGVDVITGDEIISSPSTKITRDFIRTDFVLFGATNISEIAANLSRTDITI
jgi:hypothetical protein